MYVKYIIDDRHGLRRISLVTLCTDMNVRDYDMLRISKILSLMQYDLYFGNRAMPDEQKIILGRRAKAKSAICMK